jgi:hypothetical protein
MPGDVGLGHYSSADRTAAQKILSKLQLKCRLRAELAALSEELNASVQSLTAAELAELQQLMQSEIKLADADLENMRNQVAEEAQLAKTTRPLSVVIPRKAASALAAEAERRVQRGTFPNTSALVGEAISRVYGR